MRSTPPTPPVTGEHLVAFSGAVIDPSGALVPHAAMHIAAAHGSFTRDLLTDSWGRFSLTMLPGTYDLIISAPGFDPFHKTVRIGASPVNINAHLTIAVAQSVVEVSGNTNAMSTSGDANKDGLDLEGDSLAALSDDDATFQQQLLALAGDDGSHPPQVYVDGFSGGRFPPKSTIREVKINQSPFSAAYESMGLGRIEIFTKPGTGSMHGSVGVYGDPSAFNSQNPFLHEVEPGYYRVHTVGELSGPIGKKTSFFLSADYYDQQNNAIINAQSVNSTGGIYGISEAVPDPTQTGQYSARLDRQWSTNNTVTGRYEFHRVGQTNGGLSEYVLPSEGYNSTETTQTLQLRNTQIVSANAEIDSRFEWIRARTNQNPVSTAPTITVEGVVSAGGSPSQTYNDHQDQLEFQESGTYEHGKHLIRAGGRYRLYRDANLSTAGFNGTFTFTNLASYRASILGTPSASQFQLTTGKANFQVITGDAALWAEDEWQLRRNITADLGFRVESQSAIPDHFDPSPHFGLAWALHQTDNKTAPVVLRIGSGIFYDRFPIADLMTAVRQNNPKLQQTYTVTNPGFFVNDIPSTAQLGVATPPTIYRVAPGFRSEYEIDSGASAEFSLGKHGFITVGYLNKIQEHQWVSINANAPRADGTRPYGAAAGNIYEFSSGAEGRGKWFYIDPQIPINKNISLWGHFNFKRQNSDTFGETNFASNSYDIHQDYGRSPSDRREAAYIGMNAALKWSIRTGLFLTARAGSPFNITTGSDNNGDTIYNDRPSFATSASNPADVVHTAYGDLNLNPQPGEKIIPVDYGHSAGPFVSLQLQASKTWKFGSRPANSDGSAPGRSAPPPDPRYELVFSVEAQNVTNSVSPAQPVGVLTSPFFGQPISTSNNFLSTSAANRTITLHTAISF
ncbi:MAG TPA: carboxypeptidase-like regulatory domain-containing protein [Granulicella sp.]